MKFKITLIKNLILYIKYQASSCAGISLDLTHLILSQASN